MRPVESSPSIVSLRRYCAENKKESDPSKLEKPTGGGFFARKEAFGKDRVLFGLLHLGHWPMVISYHLLKIQMSIFIRG